MMSGPLPTSSWSEGRIQVEKEGGDGTNYQQWTQWRMDISQEETEE